MAVTEPSARSRRPRDECPATAATRCDALPSRRRCIAGSMVPQSHVFGMRVALGALESPPASVARGDWSGGQGTFVKRVIRKSTAWYVEPRWATQAHFNEQVIAVATELDQFQGHVAQADADLEAQLAGLTEQLIDVLDQLTRLRQDVCPADATAGIDYVAFEERFRGDSAEVKDSQRDYVGRFASATAGGPIIDIGCGRGEMLELLRDACMEAIGVDSDDGMLAVCRRKGLTVEHGDALEWLRAQMHRYVGSFWGRWSSTSAPRAWSSWLGSYPQDQPRWGACGRDHRSSLALRDSELLLGGPQPRDRCIRRRCFSWSSRLDSPRSERSSRTVTTSPTLMRLLTPCTTRSTSCSTRCMATRTTP